MAADLVAGIFGARGSGKTYTALRYLAEVNPSRLLIVDPMDQYAEHAQLVEGLADMGKRSAAAKFALRYVPAIVNIEADVLAERFRALCALAWQRANLVLLVDEAHLFTRAQAAPPEWRALTLMGRNRGICIFGLSQRPAHMDKDFFSNATFIRSGRLNFQDDITTMANALRVPAPAVAQLVGHEWIGRDLLTGEVSCEPADAIDRARPGGAPAGPAAHGEAPRAPAKPARVQKKSARRRRPQ